MSVKNEKIFTLVFSIIVIAELICVSLDSLSQMQYIIKPLILLSLIVFFWRQSDNFNTTVRIITLLALLFSLSGDILLMFDDKSANYFTAGLVAFLLAHVMYILVFNKNKNSKKPSTFFAISLLIYGAGLFYILKDHLNDMLVPVVIYMIVILCMAFTASRRKGNVSKNSYNLILIGAIFFIVSDSLIAIDKFYTQIPFSRIFIMFTYALAQYLIVMGILRQRENIIS